MDVTLQVFGAPFSVDPNGPFVTRSLGVKVPSGTTSFFTDNSRTLGPISMMARWPVPTRGRGLATYAE